MKNFNWTYGILWSSLHITVSKKYIYILSSLEFLSFLSSETDSSTVEKKNEVEIRVREYDMEKKKQEKCFN